MELKRIRIAQIGTSGNSHGCEIFRELNKLTDTFEVVGFAFPENERTKFPSLMNRFEGYREMTVEEILSDPTIEAVSVETEEIYLTKYALMAARAGKHIHMEKPGTPDGALFRELIDVVKEKGLVLSIGYIYRFNPKVIEAINKIERGDIGDVYAVEAHMDCIHDKSLRAWLELFPSGMLYFLGCHLIDLIYRIQGEPQAVMPLSCSTHRDDLVTDDYGMVVLRYPNGISFAKTCASEWGGFLRRQLVICGTKGTLEIRPLEYNGEGGTYADMVESHARGWSEPGEHTTSEPYDRYDNMLLRFAERVHGAEETVYTPDYELRLHSLLLQCCRKDDTK